MTHTYRDSSVSRYGRTSGVFLTAWVLVFPVAWIALNSRLANGLRWEDLQFHAFALGLPMLFAYLAYRHFSYGVCKEIRLDDSGACELEANRRVIRLHVSEIKAVKYQRDREDDTETYTIRYASGKLVVHDRMTEFHDFLTRLEALNPAVDLTTFPDAWRGRAPASERSKHRLTISNALFPAAIVGLLIWLAVQTLTTG